MARMLSGSVVLPSRRTRVAYPARTEYRGEMDRVKGQSEPDLSTVSGRLEFLRDLLREPHRKRLGIAEFAQLIGLKEEAVKTWHKRDSVSKDGEEAIVAAAARMGLEGVSVAWLRKGTGPTPQRVAQGTIVVRPRLPPRIVREPGLVPSSDVTQAHAASAMAEPLSADEIAEEVARVLEPLVDELAKKGSIVVARWLLTLAGEANDQGVTDVKSIIDLARHFLYRAERAV